MVQFAKDDFDWLVSQYGEGKLSWIVGGLLSNFRQAHVHTPNELFKTSADITMNKIEDGAL